MNETKSEYCPRSIVPELRKLNVMVVEDSPDTLRLLDEMLREEGYRVLTFPDGKTALEAAADSPPDLVLLDARMPGLDAFEVCRRIKADPRLSAIPVIFFGICDDREERRRAFAVGAADYVKAPFNREAILTKVWTYTTFVELKRKLRRL